MKYLPTYESVHSHPLPQWYQDAKFGIFIHWGLFSVPAWSPEQTEDIMTQMAADPDKAFANNPYAEWYLNTLRIPGSPTQAFHKKHYGGMPYEGFQASFEEQNKNLDVDMWAKLIQDAGARYCVLVTKHHDGYTLWPTDTPNPFHPNYYSKRDFVGELTRAITARGMKMGMYYSGVFDWTFKTDRPIDSMQGFLLHQDMPKAYTDYSLAHLNELINKYKPSILWNDIAFPYGYNLNELFAYYYNTVSEGVINDRWNQIKVPKTDAEWLALAQKGQEGLGAMLVNTTTHYDFVTPEYTIYSDVKDYKWETTRGIGRSFGFNRTECGSDYLTGPEIIDMLVKTVSRNGNLLLNFGPRADGSVPFEQVKPLLEVGAWLKVNGEAIYDTTTNDVPERVDSHGHAVCFTRKADAVYAVVLCNEGRRQITIRDWNLKDGQKVQLLGSGKALWHNDGDDLVLDLPEGAPKAYAPAFRIG